MTQHPTVTEFEQFARQSAELHAEQFRPLLPDLLGGMPTPGGSPDAVHATFDMLAAALEETARAGVKDPPSSPASLYGAALLGYALAFRVFLFEQEPEDPHRAAVLCVTYAARYREQASASTPEALTFQEQADAGTLTPETAHRVLSSFPDLPTLAAFLAAHHALSLACEALGDPEGTDPRKALRESLEVMRSEVYTVTPSRAQA